MRVGLVLGGGGVLGGAWEIGALHALRHETGWDPRTADCLIGTSAGALMAALLAGGIMPDLDLVDATVRKVHAFPRPLPGSLRLGLHGLRAAGGRRWVMTAAGLLPRGVLSTEPIRQAVSRRIPQGWPPSRELLVVAADYRTGDRVVFSRHDAAMADLPAAVAASCAIPGVYDPVKIGGRSFVDGGLYSVDNLDLLWGRAIDLAICINPLSSARSPVHSTGLAGRLLAAEERIAHCRLTATAETLRDSGTQVLLIEPGREDLRVMGLNLMNRKRVGPVEESARVTVASQLRTSLLGEPSFALRGSMA